MLPAAWIPVDGIAERKTGRADIVGDGEVRRRILAHVNDGGRRTSWRGRRRWCRSRCNCRGRGGGGSRCSRCGSRSSWSRRRRWSNDRDVGAGQLIIHRRAARARVGAGRSKGRTRHACRDRARRRRHRALGGAPRHRRQRDGSKGSRIRARRSYPSCRP